MRLSFVLAIWFSSLCLMGATNETGAEGKIVAKVVRLYALTSANDFPMRDPQDWRLLGANDGGKTWTLLDKRTNELFPDRHQRRVFRSTNSVAFNLYRLQIDRVRDPSAGDSVQLAEIEPMGDTEADWDPFPTFADIITAQGEKPPLEGVRSAFDGDLETKWLDHPSQFPRTCSSWVQWQYCAPHSAVRCVRDLLSLRFKGRSFQVQIEGRVIGRLPGTNGLCFMDATGHLILPAPETASNLWPGQAVALSGTSSVVAGRGNVSRPEFAKRGPDMPAHPNPVALEEPMTPAEEWQWVEVEGQVAFYSQRADQVTFELKDADRRVWVHLLSRNLLDFERMAKERLRVRGLREGVFNSDGKLISGVIWAAGADDLKVMRSPDERAEAPDGTLAAGPGPQLLTTIGQIRQLGRNIKPDTKVKLRGVVIEPMGMFLQEGSDGIELFELNQATGRAYLAPKFGDYIEVEGLAVWVPKSGPKVLVRNLVVLGQGQVPAPAHLSWGQMISGSPIDRWVEVDGVVHLTDGSHLLLTCNDGQVMVTIRSGQAERIRNLVDAEVRIRGVGTVATDDRGQVQGVQLIVPSSDYVELRQPPARFESMTMRSLGSLAMVKESHHALHRVKVQGTVTLQQGTKVFLQDSSGGAMAVARQEAILSEPVDRKMHWLFWATPNTNQAARDMPKLKEGDSVTAVGFPEFGGESPVLTEAIFFKGVEGRPVAAAKTSVEQILRGDPNSTLVRLDCFVLGREVLGADSILQLEAGQKVFQAILSGDKGAFLGIIPGSRVSLTGVCQVERSPYAQLGKQVAAFKLLLRSPGDLVVVQRPSWWNVKHTLIVMGTLLFVLALAAGAIYTLRRQVEERTGQLKQEIEEHKITERHLAEETRRVQAEIEERKLTASLLAEKTGLLEKEIEERKQVQAEVERVHRKLIVASRMAGMAEVATGVLHNVGNVLNSVNVLASLMVAQVQKSKITSISKLAALLRGHERELGRFMEEDAKGRKIPGYIERLSGHLAQEQAELLEKVRSITDNIQHIKEIVAMQQSYAKAGGVLEQVAAQEILEDSLRMHSEALARHGIVVIREFEEVPQVTVDRHKVLQILFNLLSNAKYACESNNRLPKQVKVRIGRNRQFVHISVADNGVGIPAENLSKIFNQGFTTRKDGHGIGLHSSILSAQELGGALRAQSDGVGFGATFTLELPIAASPDLAMAGPEARPAATRNGKS